MGCVNKVSKEFKSLAANNNLSSDALELITHKYWAETGDENSLPTEVYIQAQLGNSQYQESGKAVRELWKKKYSSPQTFDTISSLYTAVKEASKYFPQSAIVHFKGSNGKYFLSVKEPVVSLQKSKDSFFEDYDSMDFKTVKKIDLGLSDKRPYTIDKVKELFDKFNTDRTSQFLADKVFEVAKNLGLQISFNDTLPEGKWGRYTNNNTITIRKSFIEADALYDRKAPVILHEILHALSGYALSESTENWEKPAALEKFKIEMNSLYQDLKDNKALEGERGVADLNEFVAELANPIFREKIKQIDAENKVKKSFWSRVLDAFKNLLGLHTSDNHYTRAMNALDKALNAFDIDTYMRYNGTKNALRNEIFNNFDKTQYERELQDIMERAIANGTFMKAPNGKPTNLNEQQWLQVRTKNFKDWFGDWEILANFAKKIKSRYERQQESLSQRFLPKELRIGDEITEEAEDLLQRGKNSSNPEFEREKTGNIQKGLAQEKELEKWAKDNKLWTTNTTTTLREAYGEPIAIGGEAEVYDNGNTVVKAISLAYFIEPQLALDRIILHNYVSNAALTVKGFGRNSNGEFVIIAEQPFIKGEKLSQDEIVFYMKSLGFTPYNSKNTEFSNGEILINDLHDENILKTPNGGYSIIDADFRLNTANYGLNGTRTTTKEALESNLPSSVSKVVDENGEPLVVYRGTRDSSTVHTTGTFRSNIIFTTTEEVGATRYGKPLALFMNAKNPAVIDYKGAQYDARIKDEFYEEGIGFTALDRKAKNAVAKGYDALIIKDVKDGTDYNIDDYAVTNPNQVKSATDNSGEFSATNNEIYSYDASNPTIQKEVELIKRENFDYDVINPSNSRPLEFHDGWGGRRPINL